MIRPEHFVMSATTFAPDGTLDEDAFRRWLHRFRDLKLGVYVGSGGNGEGHALTPAELDRVYRIAVEELKGKVPVHANLPEEHTALKTIEQARIAANAGIEVLHMYTLEGRHGMKPTDLELITYFDDVLSVIDHPVCIAVNPTIGYIPKPSVVAEIVRRHPQVSAVRLSHQPEIYLIDLQDMIEREIAYYFQFNSGTLGPLTLGATLFSAEANLLPKTFRQFLDLYDAGKLDEIGPVLAHIRRFFRYGQKHGSIPRWLKMAMRGLKLPGGEGGPRRPYLMPPEDEYQAFMDGLLKLRVPEIDEYARAAGLKV
jgi:4-hydroxy-tetrahydrodipicolinate synthase